MDGSGFAPLDLGPLYQDYAYGYPHKSAYRAFDPPLPLDALWDGEDRTRTMLYVHLPFCEMRCGFCNLFTTANASQDRISAYLDALVREARAVAGVLGRARPVQFALGGGTPTFLSAPDLDRLISGLTQSFDLDLTRTQSSVETSPATATPERLALLKEAGFDRISIGVQSFIEDEARAMGRPQRTREVTTALDQIRAAGFARLNIDLIYGAPVQTQDSFVSSIQSALRWVPEEIYLYPLYVRKRTGLDGRTSVEDEHRRALYRAGRDRLLAAGYTQVSMRCFRRSVDGPVPDEFSCQEDGVIGLGAGARSYTAKAHYSAGYAVSRSGVLGVLDTYGARSEASFAHAVEGIRIDADERARRFVLKSILRRDGLDRARFRSVFGQDPVSAFPVLQALMDSGYMRAAAGFIVPAAPGLEHSDAMAPLFYSAAVRARMQSAEVK